jgi:hypothetical protein
LEKRKCLVAGFKPWTVHSIAMHCTSYITIPHNEEGADNNCLVRWSELHIWLDVSVLKLKIEDFIAGQTANSVEKGGCFWWSLIMLRWGGNAVHCWAILVGVVCWLVGGKGDKMKPCTAADSGKYWVVQSVLEWLDITLHSEEMYGVNLKCALLYNLTV